MAQLPPKAPGMAQNWPCFPHQRLPPDSIASNPTANHEHPCWMDEFLDFSASRRGAHRRSASDSIAFLEAPMVEECRNQHLMNGGGFDRLDDEQLMSMFSDDINMPMTVPPSLSSSNPSTPSDQNSNNEEKPTPMELQQPKPEPGEVESSCKTEPLQPFTTQPSAAGNNTDTVIDPKRVKRILANRQSAQRSRVRKLQYISELERSVTTLQSEVSALSPRVAFLDHQRLILNVDNSAIKQRIAALAQDKIFKEAHQEALRKEIERLRQVYHQQSLKIMRSNNTNNDNVPQNSETMGCTDKEMLPNLVE